MKRASRKSFNTALAELTALSGFGESDPRRIEFSAQNLSLNSPFHAAEATSAALVGGALVADRISQSRGNRASQVRASSRHTEASLLSFAHLHFADQGRAPRLRMAPEQRSAAAGFFQTADDRWVYLHSGFPQQAAQMLQLLDTTDAADAVTDAVRGYTAEALEDKIAESGLCGAMVRSAQEWDDSPTGLLLASRPVVEVIQMGDSPPEPFPEDFARPLAGTNVLDLTRVLAGPTCARTLAAYGATVLRVGAEHLPSIPLFVADTGFGKRSAFLNLTERAGAYRLRELIREADVFSQGYRTGAMEGLGFGPLGVARIRTGIVYVSINCYGHEGPWRTRPGWEQLAQTVTGMAKLQGEFREAGKPELLPAAVTDYTTGYLAAYGVLLALQRRAQFGGSYWVRVSLSRTGVWIRNLGLRAPSETKSLTERELAAMTTNASTSWGPVSHLKPAVSLSETNVAWQQPPVPLGTHQASFE